MSGLTGWLDLGLLVLKALGWLLGRPLPCRWLRITESSFLCWECEVPDARLWHAIAS